ncbi:MAG: hypothetical protein ABWX68_10470, partial [Arthrobacter sp.]
LGLHDEQDDDDDGYRGVKGDHSLLLPIRGVPGSSGAVATSTAVLARSGLRRATVDAEHVSDSRTNALWWFRAGDTGMYAVSSLTCLDAS